MIISANGTLKGLLDRLDSDTIELLGELDNKTLLEKLVKTVEALETAQENVLKALDRRVSQEAREKLLCEALGITYHE